MKKIVHSRAHFSLHYFAVFEGFFFFCKKMLPMQTSLKTKKKKNLKCELMVLKAVLTSAGTVRISFWLQRNRVSSWT